MEFADFHRGLENKLKPEKRRFSRWETKEKSSSGAIAVKRTEKAYGEECLESIFILKISCELLCLMVYPAGIYMPCEMVSVMIQ